jgi:hypothetical protein
MFLMAIVFLKDKLFEIKGNFELTYKSKAKYMLDNTIVNPKVQKYFWDFNGLTVGIDTFQFDQLTDISFSEPCANVERFQDYYRKEADVRCIIEYRFYIKNNGEHVFTTLENHSSKAFVYTLHKLREHFSSKSPSLVEVLDASKIRSDYRELRRGGVNNGKRKSGRRHKTNK